MFKLFYCRHVGVAHLTGSETMSDRILCTCEKQSRRNNKAYCLVVHTGEGNIGLVVLSQLEKPTYRKYAFIKLEVILCCTYFFDCKMNSMFMFLESPYFVCILHVISVYQLAFSSIRDNKHPLRTNKGFRFTPLPIKPLQNSLKELGDANAQSSE